MANTKVTGDVIANGTISTVHLADDAITAAKLDSTATGITFADLTVDTDTLYVDAANNRVGIGTTSPSYPFHITGSGDAVAAVTAGAGSIAALNLGNFTNLADGGIRYDNGAGTLIFRTLNAEKMRIDNAGNVGIGLTSATRKLEVNGTSTFYDHMYISSSKQLQWEGGNYWTWRVNGTQFQIYRGDTTNVPFLVDTSGNVGIGTTSPAQKLDIVGKMKISDDIILAQTNGRLDYDNGNSNGALRFHSTSGNTERMRITSSGNVGIGTTNPQSNLHISTSSTNAPIRLQNDNGSGSTANFVLQTDSSGLGNNGFGIYDVANSAYRLVINGSGNVGIGTTSPAQSLDTTGKIRIRDGGNTTIPSIQMGPSGIDGLSLPTTNTVAFITNSTERMRINSSGNTTFYKPTTIEGIVADSNFPIYKTKISAPFTGGWNTLAPETTIGGIQQTNVRTDLGVTSFSAGMEFYLESNTYGTGSTGIRFKCGGVNGADSTEKMRIDSSGRVGIGTTSPESELHIKKSEATCTLTIEGGKSSVTAVGEVNSELNFGSNDPSATGDIGGSIKSITEFSNGAYVGMGFYTAQQGRTPVLKEAMRIDYAGNVGIGRTSPVSILELGDDTPTLTISDTGNNYNDGDVQAVVHLSGRWYSGESNPGADNYSDARMVLRKNYSDGTGGSSLAFETSAAGAGGLTEAIRIDKSQNVGIGTTSPAQKLDVSGIVKQNGANNYENILVKSGSTGTFTFTQSELNSQMVDNVSYFIFVSVYRPTTDATNDVGTLLLHGIMPRGSNSTFNTINTLKGSGISVLSATNSGNSLVITTDSGTTFRCAIRIIAMGGTS